MQRSSSIQMRAVCPRAPRRHPLARWLALATGFTVACVAGALATASPAAAEPHVRNRAAAVQNRSTASEYWTEDRMSNAMPLPIPEPDPSSSPSTDDDGGPSGPGVSAPGAPPVLTIAPEPLAASPEDDDVDDATGEGAPASPPRPRPPSDVARPSSAGTSGCSFSSSRLNPRTADAKYPYSAVGKLFFTKPGVGDFICSGAVLRNRVVLTAGHCVHPGNGQQGSFFANFRFCPAYRNKTSPKFGCWDWAFLTTTGDWFNGGGVVPNAADYAMIQMQDRVLGGQVVKIGELTGYFGYSTLSLSANHVHLLGYPANLSAGVQMHQVAAGRCVSGGNNTEKYGSDMRGGSSGGPWVQDFGRLSPEQTVSSPAGPNLIVGITSYSNNSTDPKYQGSSIPDTRFDSLLTTVCAHAAGNC